MKVLIIGLGSIAKKHVSALREVDVQVEIYALRHNSECTTVDGVINIFTKEDAAKINADFAIISNPTSEHLATIKWLSQLNTPLFIEKPIFDKLIELPNISVLTYVACNLRFLDCLQWVKNNIGAKRVNEVNSYCGSYLPDWRIGVDWRKSYSANKEMGGGVHIDLIHEIDYLYWIFGKPKSVQKTFKNRSSLDISAIDYANYTMSYPNFAISVVLNYYRRDYKRTLEIVCEDVTWFIDLAKNSVVNLSTGETLFCSEQKPIDTYLAQMKYFTTLVELQTKESMNSACVAVDVLKICLENEIAK